MFDLVLMKKILELLVKEGGEGVVLRKPASYYENGRSHSVLKVKVVHFFEYYCYSLCLYIYAVVCLQL